MICRNSWVCWNAVFVGYIPVSEGLILSSFKYNLNNCFASTRGMQSIAISMSVYVCGCTSLCSRISRTTCPNFVKFFVHVTCGCGSVLLWYQCNTLCNLSFVDDIMFSYNGASGQNETTLRLVEFTTWWHPLVAVCEQSLLSLVFVCIFLVCHCNKVPLNYVNSHITLALSRLD